MLAKSLQRTDGIRLLQARICHRDDLSSFSREFEKKRNGTKKRHKKNRDAKKVTKKTNANDEKKRIDEKWASVCHILPKYSWKNRRALHVSLGLFLLMALTTLPESPFVSREFCSYARQILVLG